MGGDPSGLQVERLSEHQVDLHTEEGHSAGSAPAAAGAAGSAGRAAAAVRATDRRVAGIRTAGMEAHRTKTLVAADLPGVVDLRTETRLARAHLAPGGLLLADLHQAQTTAVAVAAFVAVVAVVEASQPRLRGLPAAARMRAVAQMRAGRRSVQAQQQAPRAPRWAQRFPKQPARSR